MRGPSIQDVPGHIPKKSDWRQRNPDSAIPSCSLTLHHNTQASSRGCVAFPAVSWAPGMSMGCLGTEQRPPSPKFPGSRRPTYAGPQPFLCLRPPHPAAQDCVKLAGQGEAFIVAALLALSTCGVSRVDQIFLQLWGWWRFREVR